MGLWVRAGAWSAANMTDGYIPARVALHLGSRNLCARLVKSGLFEEAVDGFQFHQWDEKNFTKNQLLSSNSQGRDTRSDKPKRHLSTVDSSTETPRAPARAPARVAPARLRAPNPSLKDGLVTNGHQGGRGLAAALPARLRATRRLPRKRHSLRPHRPNPYSRQRIGEMPRSPRQTQESQYSCRS